MLTILAGVAEWERERIRERVAEGREYRLSQGRWASGRTLYGYRWLPKEQRWEIVPEEAKVVSYIYHLYLDEKLGSLKIPLRLNKEATAPAAGRRGVSALYTVSWRTRDTGDIIPWDWLCRRLSTRIPGNGHSEGVKKPAASAAAPGAGFSRACVPADCAVTY